MIIAGDGAASSSGRTANFIGSRTVDPIAVPPLAADGRPAVRSRPIAAIGLPLTATSIGPASQPGTRSFSPKVDGPCDGKATTSFVDVGLGEPRELADDDRATSGPIPGHGRGHIEVDVQVVGAVEVDQVVEVGQRHRAGARAARPADRSGSRLAPPRAL